MRRGTSSGLAASPWLPPAGPLKRVWSSSRGDGAVPEGIQREGIAPEPASGGQAGDCAAPTASAFPQPGNASLLGGREKEKSSSQGVGGGAVIGVVLC